jgi:hypothetical protein
MQFYPQSSNGFVMDYELADCFGFLDEFLIWESEEDELPFVEVFEKSFGLLPEGIKIFEYVHGGHIYGLEGFESDATYILFDESLEDSNPVEWARLTDFLEEQDVTMDAATWSELG